MADRIWKHRTSSGSKRATFFVSFQVTPTTHNVHHSTVAGACAACWIVAENEISAYSRARFFVAKGEWTFIGDKIPISEVTEKDFEEREIGLAQFRVAQKEGIAIVYTCWSLDGKSESGPVRFEQPQPFDLNTYVSRKKKLSKTGRCLHYASGKQCGDFISAHSIQKNGQLSVIAHEGHVYALSMNVGDIKKNDGEVSLIRHGIGGVSTFNGFCKNHDNELFAPIDKIPLVPTSEQVLLYAYRSLCREVFVKENALNLIESQIRDIPEGSAMRPTFETMKMGMSISLENLRAHKSKFDLAISSKTYLDVEYLLFTSEQPQTIAFSGLFYPEFDFLGKPLQDLVHPECRYDLITFCSAPVQKGWGFLFAWHKSSAPTCREFIESLAVVTKDDQRAGADAMFRMVVSTCENTAFSPLWWERQSPDQKAAVIECLNRGVDLHVPIEPDYLRKGAEGVSQWNFDDVYAMYE